MAVYNHISCHRWWPNNQSHAITMYQYVLSINHCSYHAHVGILILVLLSCFTLHLVFTIIHRSRTAVQLGSFIMWMTHLWMFGCSTSMQATPDVHTVKTSQLDQLETCFQAWCIHIWNKDPVVYSRCIQPMSFTWWMSPYLWPLLWFLVRNQREAWEQG